MGHRAASPSPSRELRVASARDDWQVAKSGKFIKRGRPLDRNGLSLKPGSSGDSAAKSEVAGTFNTLGAPPIVWRTREGAYAGRGPGNAETLIGVLECPGAENGCDELSVGPSEESSEGEETVCGAEDGDRNAAGGVGRSKR